MKLRLKGNSVRLRLTPSDVTALCDHGIVEESADFGGGQVLTYRLQSADSCGPVRATFRNGTVVVAVSAETVRKWAESDEVGIYAQSGALAVSVEKDLRCSSRPDDEPQPAACVHPAH